MYGIKNFNVVPFIYIYIYLCDEVSSEVKMNLDFKDNRYLNKITLIFY